MARQRRNDITPEALFARIRGAIRQSPVWQQVGSEWERVARGEADAGFEETTRATYQLLTSEPHRIEGLSLAAVSNAELMDHSWLLAHHRAVGFFMIDPAAGHILQHSGTGQGYDDVFIGTYEDLEKKVAVKKEYRVDGDIPFYLVWSPVTRFQNGVEVENQALWRRCPQPVIPDPVGNGRKMTEGRRLGEWAARMEEQGLNWRQLMAACHGQKAWPDPRQPEQGRLYKDIRHARNRQIEIHDRNIGQEPGHLREYYTRDRPAHRR